MNDIKQRLQNERCRLTTNDTGQKMLTQTDGRGLLVWTTLSEYSLQIQVDGEERLLTDGEASAEECPEKGAWVRRYRHGLLTAEVSYILTGTAALKTVRVTAGVPLTLRYAYTETAVFSGPLDRGGEGQPLFAGNRGFIASECPVAENRADGHTFSLRQAPFVSLKAGETFALSPVVLEGFPLLRFSGILPEGLSGPAPTGGLLSCTNKKVTKEVAGGLCRPPGPQALSFETCSRSVPSG